jgi:hypothetical protein
MEIIILVIILVVVSYILGERAFRARRLPFESLIFLVYGTEFVLIGILLGPYIFGLLGEDIIDRLEPLINIALGWIGLMFGFQFRVKDLKLLPFSNFLVAAIESSVTYILVLAALMLIGLLWWGIPPSLAGAVPLIFVLAAISMVSSPTIVTGIIKRTGAHGRVSRLMRYASGFDNVLGLLVFGVTYAFFHYTTQQGDPLMSGWLWLLVSIGLGIALGALFHFFTAARATSNENLMIAVGMVALSSGIAYYLHLSALFINLIVGAVLCNYSERQDRLYRLLITAEQPLYGILLIIAAALWRFSWTLVALVVIVIAVRTVAKTVGGIAALRRYGDIVRYPQWFGPALIAQGGMALAIALDYRFLAPGEASGLLLAVVLTTLAIQGFISPLTIRHLLKREGEIA